MTAPMVCVPVEPTEAIKMGARMAVRRALDSGALVRPALCERCGDSPPPASDGRAMIHGHHHDYAQPLDVEWICAKCHRAETPLPEKMGAAVPGERNGQAKLSASDVLAARRMREVGGETYKEIAARFGVNKTTAMRAIKGEHWSHISEDA